MLTLHGGAAEVGLVSAARWLPYLLFGVFAGVFIERARRRPVLVTTDLVRCILLTAIPTLAVTHRLSLAVLVAFMSVFGLASLANDAASQSFLPRLVPQRLLTRANARLDQSDAVAQTSGPALAGGLVSLLTAPWAVLVDAASYLASGLVLLRVRVVEPPARRLSLRGVRSEASEGLRWLYRHPTLRPQALSTHGWFLVNAIAGATLPLFALRTLGLSPFGLGLALAAGGVRRLRRRTVPARTHHGHRERERDGLRPDGHARPSAGTVECHQAFDQQSHGGGRSTAGRSAHGRRGLPPDALPHGSGLRPGSGQPRDQSVPARPHRRRTSTRGRVSGHTSVLAYGGHVIAVADYDRAG